MTYRQIKTRPGVIKDETALGAFNYWSDSDRIRFVRGRPQKLGGWAKFLATALTGIQRGMLAWTDFANNRWIVLGADCKLSAINVTTIVNITPERTTSPSSGTLANPFSTTINEFVVNVAHTTHNLAQSDYVEFDSASAVGGITIDGNYQITRIVDADNYEITHSVAATSTAGPGGGAAVGYLYELECGLIDAAKGLGYGVGNYGAGDYGNARADGSFINIDLRIWSISQWGQNVVMCPWNGSIYDWDRTVANRAAILSNAPTPNKAIFATEEQHLVALGADGSNMLVQWCDQSNNNVWAELDTTTAGSRLLEGGSTLLWGVATKGTNLVFSDGSVWTMTFVGGLDVFGFDQIGSGGAGIIGPRAGVDIQGRVYWMGQNDFFMYDGSIKEIPNSKDVRRFVFDNLTKEQKNKAFAWVNSLYSEVWWHYPGASSIENNLYVKYNWVDKSWDVGTLARTSGIDSGSFPLPLMVDTSSFIQEHETGKDDDGSAMNEFIVHSPAHFEGLPDRFDIMGVIPDFNNVAGSIDLAFLVQAYPQGAIETVVLDSFVATTDWIDAHLEARLAALKISSDEAGTDWRLGTLHYDIEDGGPR